MSGFIFQWENDATQTDANTTERGTGCSTERPWHDELSHFFTAGRQLVHFNLCPNTLTRSYTTLTSYARYKGSTTDS